jgi:hypothetical protein
VCVTTMIHFPRIGKVFKQILCGSVGVIIMLFSCTHSVCHNDDTFSSHREINHFIAILKDLFYTYLQNQCIYFRKKNLFWNKKLPMPKYWPFLTKELICTGQFWNVLTSEVHAQFSQKLLTNWLQHLVADRMFFLWMYDLLLLFAFYIELQAF